MECQIDDRASQRTIHLLGRLAFSDNHAMRAIIQNIEGAPRTLTIDLSGLEFLDSAGLGLLLLVREAAKARNWPLVFKGARNQVGRLLHLTRFEQLATMVD